jgi:hypothetical protein
MIMNILPERTARQVPNIRVTFGDLQNTGVDKAIFHFEN